MVQVADYSNVPHQAGNLTNTRKVLGRVDGLRKLLVVNLELRSDWRLHDGRGQGLRVLFVDQDADAGPVNFFGVSVVLLVLVQDYLVALFVVELIVHVLVCIMRSICWLVIVLLFFAARAVLGVNADLRPEVVPELVVQVVLHLSNK